MEAEAKHDLEVAFNEKDALRAPAAGERGWEATRLATGELQQLLPALAMCPSCTGVEDTAKKEASTIQALENKKRRQIAEAKREAASAECPCPVEPWGGASAHGWMCSWG
eukprot:Skav219665  [mRNA]  locus=scaffold1257:376536:378590:+ [translate_table: standard]